MIKVTVGVSGSGKSTWAKQEWEKNPLKTVIINRDKIRELLWGYTESTVSEYYSRTDLNKLEKEITLYEDTLINEALCQNKTVIVDATHLKISYLKRFEYWNVPIEYICFNVLLKEAITRDIGRKRSVGEEVIKKQYSQYLELQRQGVPTKFEPISFKQSRNLPPCVIYDIDGTIAKMNGRNAFDWHKIGQDLVVSNVTATIDWVSDLQEVHRPTVIIVSGRDGICYNQTYEWLIDNNIYFDKLILRKEKDQRADWIIKEEIWRDIIKDYYIVGMYDDRNQVTRRARALGLKVFQVEYGNF